jgi:hypothetical protein
MKNMRVSTVVWMIMLVLVGLVVISIVVRFFRIVNRPWYIKRDNFWTYPFKTGDLVITCVKTSGRSLLSTSALIKFFTNSPYHHVAIVYVEPDTGQVFFWEMNGGGTRLATVLDMVAGRHDQFIAVRSLNKPVDTALFERVLQTQWNYMFNMDICLAWYHRYMCPWIPVPFLKGLPWGNDKQRTCAHMTTEMYNALGVLDFESTGVDPSAIFATDYATEQIDRRIIPLANGFEFGPVTLLDYKHYRKNK